MLKPAQQGQQVHFSHTNLQNLIQHFVDWRIKLFTRTSSLCSGPRCGKQIFLSCAELGSVPPSFYIPRKKKLKKKGKKKTPKNKKTKTLEGEKKRPFQVEYRTQSQVSESTVQNFCWPSAETNTDSLFVISWNLSPPTSPLFQHPSLQTSLHLT